MKKLNPKLKPYNTEIQVCPDCGKVDVDDKHICTLSRSQREERDTY